MSEVESQSMIQKVLDKMSAPSGDIIFAKVAGSHSHNCNVPTSDVDALGVYVADIDSILGLDDVEDTVTTDGNNCTLHEVGKFCHLLLKGNPTVVEMLWTDRMCYETAMWLDLKKERKRFLTCRVLEQYLGYMISQMRKLEKGTSVHTTGGQYNEKFAYHFLRLGGDAVAIARGDDPQVWKEEGHERDVLMKARAGKYSQAWVLDRAKTMIDFIDGKKPWPLPEDGDREWLNDWLLWVRKGSER